MTSLLTTLARTVSPLVLAAVLFGGAAIEVGSGVWPGRGVAAPTAVEVRDGSWVDAIESELEGRTALRRFLRPRYAELSYLAFGEMQQGVVEGEDRWLFLERRMLTQSRAQREGMARSMRAMGRIGALLEARGIDLALVVTPRAYTVYPEALPARPRRPYAALYGEIVEMLRGEGLTVLDVLDDLRASERRTFLKNDLHWRPEGALVAARAAARDLRDEGFDGGAPPGEPIDLVVQREEDAPFVGQELLRLGFTPGGALERRFHDQVRWARIVRPEDPETHVEAVEETCPILAIGTSMSGNRWPFLSALMAELGVGINAHVRAGFAAGYRGVDLARYWAVGALPLPQVLVWEIPEDFYAYEERYLFEPLESIVELLEESPLQLELVPDAWVSFDGVRDRAPASADVREEGVVDESSRITLEIPEGRALGPGAVLHFEVAINPARSVPQIEVRIEWFEGGERIGSSRRLLRASEMPHPIVVRLDPPEGREVDRIVIHPSDRTTWMEFGRFAILRPAPR